MKRFKRYKVKKERSANSSDLVRDKEEHDLAYYIHDRVELMHQVFSCLKYRELKSMAPECVRHISLDDLQELCTEELLGISSKRLCAIMDGAEPPSDTESSSPSPSPENLETISLDSISSDEEILSQASSKKHKKHKHHHGTKAKSKRKKSVDKNVSADKSQATRAGLTVLELLELQARARAIRAQLQQEQLKKQPTETVVAPPSRDSSDGEVEIKEEQAEVVEISSDEEKPKIEDLQAEVQSSKEMQPVNQHETTTVTKRVNDLIITVPQTTSPRKIKLNRNKSVSASITDKSTNIATTCHIPASSAKNDIEETKIDKPKKKKKDKKQKVDKAGSDNDEITLQLSDSEKMDLLEDLHRKSVSSMDSKSSSDDSDSSESATMSDEVKITVDEKLSLESEQKLNDSNALDKNKKNMSTESISEKNIEQETVDTVEKCDKDITVNNEIDKTNSGTALVTLNTQLPPEGDKNINDVVINNTYTDVCDSTIEITIESTEKQASIESLNPKESEAENVLEVTKIDDILIEVSNTKQPESESACVRNNENSTESSIEPKQNEKDSVNKDNTDLETEYNDKKEPKDMNGTEMEVVSLKENESTLKTNMETKQLENDLSEGEISGNESSEVKAVSINHEVVCISDDERKRSQKKKKKKDKKSKKEKKNKKKDFHESSDQNFYKNASKINEKESSEKSEVIKVNDKIVIVDLNVLDDNFNIDNTETSKKESVNSKNENSDKNPDIITIDNEHYRSENVDTINVDDIYQILELSDDSSCYEIDGAVLSIEPTTQEMETLSAKIDEFERVEVITDEEIREYEEASKLKDISWKDRYLDSTKVKKVLTTSQIFNALRKKNKELKSKILESKKNVEIEQHLEVETDKDKVVEGTIDHYNTLQASTKYVDPVKEMTEEDINTLTGAMKKDAKQLLKMYKRLLKYNDMNKQKDSKKRKKKKKTEKNDESVVNKEVDY